MRNPYLQLLLICALLSVSSCEEFIKVDPPRTDLITATVFADDATAWAAMTDIYYQISSTGFASGTISSITLVAALSSDELINGITYNNNFEQVSDNAIIPTNSLTNFLWQDMYSCIYKCNAILEGLTDNDAVSESTRKQLIGEAKFFRAFSHFYLLVLFGDIPLVVSTDYSQNESIPRSEGDIVYKQIISDLVDAQNLLLPDYTFSKGEKIRANRAAATAFLARVCLYREDWSNAEIAASAVIESSGYALEGNLKDVFLENSDEAIFQLYPPPDGLTNDVVTFLGYGFELTPGLSASFEAGDLRKANWVEYGIWGPFDYPTKYYSIDGSFSEYSMVLRLAEQYLIRAEARARLNDITGSQDDINAIRGRAGLAGTGASDATTLVEAILQERRVEFFTEWGHRWLDLKRSGLLDTAVGPLKPFWVSTASLYPIPETQLKNDANMTQNPGY